MARRANLQNMELALAVYLRTPAGHEAIVKTLERLANSDLRGGVKHVEGFSVDNAPPVTRKTIRSRIPLVAP